MLDESKRVASAIDVGDGIENSIRPKYIFYAAVN
jgi:hypothetical protein